MEKFFTENRDCDRIILSKLDDVELFYFTLPYINRYSQKLCDENFWRNRVTNKYSKTVVNFKPKEMSWRYYYLVCVKGMKDFIFVDGDPIFYNYILKQYEKCDDIILKGKMLTCYNRSYYDLFLYLVNYWRRKQNFSDIEKDSEEYISLLSIWSKNHEF
jgi:hypothetical protein